MRRLGRYFWRFMVIFSFIVNIVLLVVVGVLLLTLFDIKRNIAQPLVGGLYSAFVGLEDATIDWTIPVRANIPVNLDIPLKQNTIVTLTQAVPLTDSPMTAGVRRRPVVTGGTRPREATTPACW